MESSTLIYLKIKSNLFVYTEKKKLGNHLLRMRQNDIIHVAEY